MSVKRYEMAFDTAFATSRPLLEKLLSLRGRPAPKDLARDVCWFIKRTYNNIEINLNMPDILRKFFNEYELFHMVYRSASKCSLDEMGPEAKSLYWILELERTCEDRPSEEKFDSFFTIRWVLLYGEKQFIRKYVEARPFKRHSDDRSEYWKTVEFAIKYKQSGLRDLIAWDTFIMDELIYLIQWDPHTARRAFHLHFDEIMKSGENFDKEFVGCVLHDPEIDTDEDSISCAFEVFEGEFHILRENGKIDQERVRELLSHRTYRARPLKEKLCEFFGEFTLE